MHEKEEELLVEKVEKYWTQKKCSEGVVYDKRTIHYSMVQ